MAVENCLLDQLVLMINCLPKVRFINISKYCNQLSILDVVLTCCYMYETMDVLVL